MVGAEPAQAAFESRTDGRSSEPLYPLGKGARLEGLGAELRGDAHAVAAEPGVGAAFASERMQPFRWARCAASA